jgi:hypothetical protein
MKPHYHLASFTVVACGFFIPLAIFVTHVAHKLQAVGLS